jgi:hypothetical protein
VRRLALFLSVVAGALVAPATPAFAHGGGTPASSSYRTAVAGISPPMPGLSVRAVEGGARLELRNETGRTIEILGAAGEPYLEVRPDGTYQNVSAPTVPPAWRRVSGSTTVRWHDERTHWPGPGLPAAAVADPSRSHRVRAWSVPLRDQVREFEVRGSLDWLPAPVAWRWWAGAALFLLVAMVIAGGPVALFGGAATIAYAVLIVLDGHSPPLVLVIAGIVALAAGTWSLRRRIPFGLALAGAILAVFGGFANAAVFSSAVVPVAGPYWIARACVLVAIGAGLAMIAAGVRGLRVNRPEPAA